MKIAIISDIHDHDKNMYMALRDLKKREIGEMICLGDIIAPNVLESLITTFDKNIHMVLGNNDGDIGKFTVLAEKHPKFQLYGHFGEVDIDDIRFAFTHAPQMSHALARSGMYDVVLFGHTHAQHSEIIGNVLLANPGAIRDPFVPENHSSFAIIDTKKPKEIEFIEMSSLS